MFVILKKSSSLNLTAHKFESDTKTYHNLLFYAGSNMRCYLSLKRIRAFLVTNCFVLLIFLTTTKSGMFFTFVCFSVIISLYPCVLLCSMESSKSYRFKMLNSLHCSHKHASFTFSELIIRFVDMQEPVRFFTSSSFVIYLVLNFILTCGLSSYF